MTITNTQHYPEIIAIGTFGIGVGRAIEDLLANVDRGGVNRHHTKWAASPTASVVVTWCARRNRLDEAAHNAARRGIPFIPLVLETNMLRLGPIIMPSGDICWECWNARRLQTSSFPNELEILDQLYNCDPDSGPKGFPSVLVVIAAASVVRLLHDPAVLRNSNGVLWETNIFTQDVTCSTLTGIDACTRCGLQRPLETRSYDQLAKTLGDVATITGRARS